MPQQGFQRDLNELSSIAFRGNHVMAFFRSYIAPFFIVLIFAIAMLAVSARIFLPSDLAAPAPVEDPDASAWMPGSSAIAQFCLVQSPPIS